MYFELHICPVCFKQRTSAPGRLEPDQVCHCPADDPDEARRILADLHKATSEPAPREDAPFALRAEVARWPAARQRGLFD